MKSQLFAVGFVGALALITIGQPKRAEAVSVTFDNEATFIAALATVNTFDFEVASGFPIANAGFLGSFSDGVIGPYLGVHFDAHTYSGVSTSGTQGMAGGLEPTDVPTFNVAYLSFAGMVQRPTALGFYGLDLTEDEEIVVTVFFTSGAIASYDVTLGGAAAFTPIYFGVMDSSDTIVLVQFFGADGGDQINDRAWALDDLTVDGVLTPEPSSLVLFALGTLLLPGAAAHRRRVLS